MNRIHIRRLIGVLTGLAATLAAAVAGAPSAFAQQYPPPGPWARPRHPIPFPPHTHAAIAAGAMAGWQIALIAVGAAILGAAVAVLLARARAARRHRPATA
jgi:hypothetical protein